MRRYKGKCDIFFGIEHRVRKEDMEEQFNKEAKDGWKFAAAGSEDRKHTSGGVFVAVDSNWGSGYGSRRRGNCVDPRKWWKNCPSIGECQRRIACLLCVFLALRRLDSEE